MDWDTKWEEHNRGRMSLAVLCTKCNKTASICDCAKALWILEQRDILDPGSVEKPFICTMCQKGTFHVWHSFSADTNTHVPFCWDCLQIHSKDSRHSKAFVDLRGY